MGTAVYQTSSQGPGERICGKVLHFEEVPRKEGGLDATGRGMGTTSAMRVSGLTEAHRLLIVNGAADRVWRRKGEVAAPGVEPVRR
jgi:hypothetical protein